VCVRLRKWQREVPSLPIAFPGDKPGTIVLEDFALAMIPHAPFLLDKLRPQDPVKNPPTNYAAIRLIDRVAQFTLWKQRRSGGLRAQHPVALRWSSLSF
jgi:hypothetical protein